jgi:methylase of polypeptide subunit release factors
MNKISKSQFKKYIEVFDFTGLFNQLGWSYLDEQTPVKLKEETYLFHSVAEKGGFRILVFKPAKHQDLPDYATRLQLDRKIGKLYREHLIIFCDKNNTTQIWQLFVKQLGKPSRLSETRWHKGQEPELLYQKTSNLFFTLDQEENITIADVVDLVNENFSRNVEQVTKKFYENFRKEHKKFIEFIKGISVVTDREWYASLMLNRLMFCYFIQKKGFLDNNLNYLKDKLAYCQAKKGKDKFYVSFYKNFLLALFHQGLGSPDQPEELKKEIGKIPYLNGGLFDVHELEKQYENIDISDEGFENIFHFFDQYNWHLDTRITATGKDINPDVIGYIFEKYINDRAQMGAYYTKEDITDYISKNTIIPFLFDETFRKLRIKNDELQISEWVKESGDTYIYDAVKKGINTESIDFATNIDIDAPDHPLWADLPNEIRNGFRPDLKDRIVDNTTDNHLWQIRKEWNKPAPENIALPTEIYREVIDRRKRYWELRKKIENGDINHINDFITYNLNIRQFAQDVIDSHSDPDFIRHFYEALSNITIIDPTCGSGAFLFAAMNILEPLYESCIQRMENFVAEAAKGKFKFFEEVLEQVKSPEHPNLSYFIYKSIILRNLYGVDIMKEAVEIAKLRLFLKLVATVEADYKKPNLGLEPLPDIDFNIRSGNTLIGYAIKKEIDDLQGMFVTPKMKEQILEECDLVSKAFQRFKEIQLKGYENKNEFTKAKTELNNRLDKLADNLNKILHKQHYEGSDYGKWLETHQPFHWFAEFYEIINDKNGFDVVIGNPPYVEYSVARKTYRLPNSKYLTEKSGNLFAFVLELCTNVSSIRSKVGMIIPLSAFCTARMEVMNKLLYENFSFNYISYFGFRPAKLFEGANRTIGIGIYDRKRSNIKSNTYTTAYRKWSSEYREFLFETINYYKFNKFYINYQYPKIEQNVEDSILDKVFKKTKKVANYRALTEKKHCIYYRNVGGLYWKIITDIAPLFYEDGKKSTSSRESHLFLQNKDLKAIILSLFNSNLFWYYYNMTSDCWSLNPSDLWGMPINIDEMTKKMKDELINLSISLMKDLQKNATWAERVHKGKNQTRFQQFTPRISKPLIDEIDTVLAEHYGFTEEELDFIINYDIKYRMGKELEEDN